MNRNRVINLVSTGGELIKYAIAAGVSLKEIISRYFRKVDIGGNGVVKG